MGIHALQPTRVFKAAWLIPTIYINYENKTIVYPSLKRKYNFLNVNHILKLVATSQTCGKVIAWSIKETWKPNVVDIDAHIFIHGNGWRSHLHVHQQACSKAFGRDYNSQENKIE